MTSHTASRPAGVSGYYDQACYYRSVSWIQVPPIAYSLVQFRRLFVVHKFTCGKLESVSLQHSMKIDEQWECRTLCAIRIKARTGGKKGRHLWPRLVQKSRSAWKMKKKKACLAPTIDKDAFQLFASWRQESWVKSYVRRNGRTAYLVSLDGRSGSWSLETMTYVTMRTNVEKLTSLKELYIVSVEFLDSEYSFVCSYIPVSAYCVCFHPSAGKTLTTKDVGLWTAVIPALQQWPFLNIQGVQRHVILCEEELHVDSAPSVRSKILSKPIFVCRMCVTPIVM